ncbi:Pyrroline-5-carboxylate reductase [Erysiphe necator]|nr:Pyrroline-5-carboxylate reductase [Erysiphe necator]
MTGGTLLIIGCGNLGTAILSGILSSIFRSTQPNSDSNYENSKLTRFIAYVRQPESAERIKKVLGPVLSQHVEIEQHQDNRDILPGIVKKADYIILGCKPNSVRSILEIDGMNEATRDKVLMSICAGVTTNQIANYLSCPRCSIVRVMPNIAASVKQSMTVISSDHPLPFDVSTVISWIFSNIGQVAYLSDSQMDTATALSGSGPGFFALLLESAIEGALAMGMPRDVATRIAAQSMKGTAELILAGEHPAILKDKVSSPGGCTVGGLAILEEGAVRSHVAKAIREASKIAGKLGSK